jgi:hypothetical protein
MTRRRKKQLMQVVVLPPVYRQPGSENTPPGSDGISAPNDRNTQKLVRGWSAQYRRPVTLAEVQEINRNLAHFFDVMLSWERQFKQQGLLKEEDEPPEGPV